MQSNKKNKDKLIKAISKIVGIKESKIEAYSQTNELENLIKRPNTMDLTEKQLDKIKILNDFIINYNITKQFSHEDSITFRNKNDMGKYFQNLIGDRKDKEVFMCAFLDKNNQLIESKVISEGTLGAAVIFPRELVKNAINSKCKSVVFAHNHPSGISEPSREDIDLTKNYINILNPLGIHLLDHIIVGEDITSLKDRGDIRVEKDFKFIDNVTSGNDMGKKYYNNHKMMLGMALSNLSGIEPSVSNNYIDSFLKYNNTSNSNNISNMVAESEKIKDSVDLTKKEHMKLLALKEFLDNYNSNTSETSIKNKVDSPSKMMGLFNGKISPEDEVIYLMLFNTKLGLLGIEKITESEGNQMKINQKDILIKTLSYDAASVSLVHVNSPNKNKAFALGKDLSQNVFNMLGPLQLKNIDYLLVNDNNYISLKEKGVMPYIVVGAAEYNNVTIMSEEIHNEVEYEEIEEEEEWELEF